jgi:hypothetical protein
MSAYRTIEAAIRQGRVACHRCGQRITDPDLKAWELACAHCHVVICAKCVTPEDRAALKHDWAVIETHTCAYLN